MSPRLYVIFISCIATLGGLLFGYDTAVISGTTQAIQTRFALTDLALGWVVSSALVGCVVGTLMAGWFADSFGRKPGLLLSAALFTVSALGCAAATSVSLPRVSVL